MDQLGALYAAARPDEYARLTLDRLAVAAGLGWRCLRCPWVNRVGSHVCGGCGHDTRT